MAKIFLRRKQGFIIKALLILLSIVFATCSFAEDVVKLSAPLTKGQKYVQYKRQVLERALELSTPEFGPYVIHVSDLQMKSRRALLAMQSGDMVNVASLAANKKWDQLATPIRVPVRGGMVSYRLLLVNKEDLFRFGKIHRAQELRELTAGTQDHWTVTTLLKADNFKHISANNFDGMFSMLSNRRLDYIPRAIYEIFEEYQALAAEKSSIVIEPSIAMFIPMVSYFYVTPTEKRLAQRLDLGMKRLANSGELKEIFTDYFGQDIVKANFEHRTIIEVQDNYFLSQLPYFTSNMLWSIDSFQTSKRSTRKR
ncbi:hypothetical protein K0504_18005 [Neiella marina]|uniref:Solute-binding protein family 3/N-terminal domain-containing protein n=1 Tax=Neiella holothuriorum TaxID=2870530 RepID=A0ABS7EKP4_9GAMM|nr:hypothetical protein [Neiella holothuriorum]MBW8192932.1 hypothetical protein [Neiella holothuriorum]